MYIKVRRYIHMVLRVYSFIDIYYYEIFKKSPIFYPQVYTGLYEWTLVLSNHNSMRYDNSKSQHWPMSVNTIVKRFRFSY